MNRWFAWGMLIAASLMVSTGQSAMAAERVGQPGPEPIMMGQPVQVVGGPVYNSSAGRWRISYRHHHLGPKCRCCQPPINMILQVKEPCGCCLIDVPVCVPGCCAGVPEVQCRRGLFGRQIVTYDWCCGNHLKIVMTRHGDLTVHYFGR